MRLFHNIEKKPGVRGGGEAEEEKKFVMDLKIMYFIRVSIKENNLSS